MRAAQIIQSLAAVALLAIPATAMAAPDQNSGPNQNQNNCGYTGSNGQWVRTSCNGQNGYGNNGQNGRWNNGHNGRWSNGRNGQWNNGRNRDDRGDNDDRRNRDTDDNNGRRDGSYNNGSYNNGYNVDNGYNGNYGNAGGYGYGNRNNAGAALSGSVSSFSPFNLYLSNGTHVELHNGTVINPTGANLTPGTRVRVIGNWIGNGVYNANEIDVMGHGGRGY